MFAPSYLCTYVADYAAGAMKPGSIADVLFIDLIGVGEAEAVACCGGWLSNCLI